MLLSAQIAANIVSEVNAVIPLKINIMDDRGIIIASTDKARIGSFHEGAYETIKKQADEITVHYDGEYDGALQGINYPLKLQDCIVGVLGITGIYEEIAQSANIIKRMTELLLENAYSLEQKHINEQIRNRYLAEWLNGEAKDITSSFIKRGRLLDFDITIPRRILVCSFYQPEASEDMQTMQTIEQVEDFVKKSIINMDKLNMYYKAASTLVCVVTTLDDWGLTLLAKELKRQVEEQFSIRMAIGIDSRVDSFIYMQTALSHAHKANKACMRTHRRDIRFYNDLNMEIFTDEITELTKMEFIRRIFKGYTDEEIRSTMILLEVYYDSEGSLCKTSDRLYIHKNTLQYKLHQIYERTGYDPRSIRHSSLFYIAIYFYREIVENM